MKIKTIEVHNFRLLKDTVLTLGNNESWLIGKNNSGKTSFLVLLDYFYNRRYYKFDYNDFSKSLREKILNINFETDIHKLSIRLIFEIFYDTTDDLSNISEFITDLSLENNTVKFALEAIIDKEKLLKKTSNLIQKEKANYIKKNISEFINIDVNILSTTDDLKSENRSNLIKKDIESVKKVINFQLINAKRDVASSDEKTEGKRMLSNLATKYFNSQNELFVDKTKSIEDFISQVDIELDGKYSEFFTPFLKNANTFLNMHNIRVESDLKSQGLLTNMSKVVYGEKEDSLPEYLNGLGYMNILFLLLNIEINKQNFLEEKKDINLLCIEEPESHTHPQMQYVFAREISKLLTDIPNIQTLITTHSSHMISQCDFENLKYFKIGNDNVSIINFEEKMLKLYSGDGEKELYYFLKKYLSIQSTELFFADKVIFIEGMSERILINYFLKLHDDNILKKIETLRNKSETGKKDNSDEIAILEKQILLSQNITILEAGANAKAFDKFLQFLEIKSLIITDIDSIDETDRAIDVANGVNTSNATISHFYSKENIEDIKQWFSELILNPKEEINNKLKVSYQIKENEYNARSFEDSFINSNLDLINKFKDQIDGLKNKKNINDETIVKIKSKEIPLYDFVYGKRDKEGKLIEGYEGIINNSSKSLFAASIYYISLLKDFNWNVPKYIEEGLIWMAK